MRAGLLDLGLQKAGANALLILAESSRDPGIAAFAGSVHLGQCFLLAARHRAPLLGFLVDMERQEAAASGLELYPAAEQMTDLRNSGATDQEIWAGILAGALAQAGLAQGTIALAGSPPAGRSHGVIEALVRKGFRFTSGDELALRCRKPKSEHELDQVRRAAAGTCSAFRRVAAILAGATSKEAALWHNDSPLTAGVLRAEIASTLATFGLEQPEGNIVACGGAASVPHTQGADSDRLRPHEAIVVDLYPRNRLFADCTRTFCVGKPEEALVRAHSLCVSALERAQAAAAPGASGVDLHLDVCSFFEQAGFATVRSEPGARSGYVHGLGHGVGYQLHEYPSFRSVLNGTGTLEAGDVFTLEPGLYAPEDGYGVRVEDLFAITGSGVENLTPLPRSLDPGVW